MLGIGSGSTIMFAVERIGMLPFINVEVASSPNEALPWTLLKYL